jgi:hypothetical protein
MEYSNNKEEFIENNDLISSESSRKVIENEIERNKIVSKQEKNRNKRQLNRIREKAGLNKLKDLFEEVVELSRKLRENRQKFENEFYEILNMIVRENKQRVCISNYITIRDNSIYYYHTSRVYSISNLLDSERTQEKIYDKIDDEDYRKQLEKSINYLKNCQTRIKTGFDPDYRLYEGENSYVLGNPTKVKVMIVDKEEYTKEKALKKANKRFSSGHIRLGSSDKRDIEKLCKNRDDIYNCYLMLKESIKNQIENEQEIFNNVISNHKSLVAVRELSK